MWGSSLRLKLIRNKQNPLSLSSFSFASSCRLGGTMRPCAPPWVIARHGGEAGQGARCLQHDLQWRRPGSVLQAPPLQRLRCSRLGIHEGSSATHVRRPPTYLSSLSTTPPRSWAAVSHLLLPPAPRTWAARLEIRKKGNGIVLRIISGQSYPWPKNKFSSRLVIFLQIYRPSGAIDCVFD